MAHTWKYALGLGFVAAALSVACTVTSDDDGVAGAAGESASGGKGGTGTGGTGGTTGGKGGGSGTGGSTGGTTATGGSAGEGTGGSTSGAAGEGTGGSTGGTGGTTGGTGGSTSGSGGTGGDAVPPASCDGDTAGTPYPDCEPGPDSKDDACALCIQKSCCEQSKNCYATDPYNVCGWGGPTMDDPEHSVFTGAGEIGCITTCLSDYVKLNEVCDSDGIDDCTTRCQTEMCTVVGSATNELFTCMQKDCSSDCFGADACN